MADQVRRGGIKRRIRATFSPPANMIRCGAIPEQIEREAEGVDELAEQLRELIYGGSRLLDLKATLTVRIEPVTP